MEVIKIGNKEIRLAPHSGFCYGVAAAVRKAEEAAAAPSSGGKIYTYGPLIHNQAVIDELAEKGVFACDDTDAVSPGSSVIIRAHGVPYEVEKRLSDKGVKIIDATCPHVKKIHRMAEEASVNGDPVIVIGDPKHPEVLGTCGRVRDGSRIHVVERSSDIDDLDISGDERPVAVCQTTITERLWNECAEALVKRFPGVQLKCTICDATRKRQDACRITASGSDMMIVIGDRKSSNSRKLFEISSEVCKNTFFIEKIDDLPLKNLTACYKIGASASASTPDRIIKEVISVMSEDITNNYEEVNEMQEYMEEIEKSLRLPGRGEMVTGSVILVTDKEVIVNLGCKKDGIIPKDEIAGQPDMDLASQFKEGDEVQAKVIKPDDGDGNILLSRKKLEVNEHWEEINAACENKETLEVKVVREVKGGVIANYKEVSGFIPMSQLSDKYTEKADEYIGKTLTVKCTRVDQRKNKAVFSHKIYLNEQKAQKVAEIWANINVGDVLEGTVMRFTDYGAFVDIGGIDGLLHISEISWGKLKHPQEVLKIGEKINVKILSMNEESGKISLGLKQNTPEPWSVINEKYSVGQVVEGKVVQIKEYGAFVELEPGLDGLVHISEIAHKRVGNVAEEISVGQVINAKILEIDPEKRRISLSIKETIDAPAEEDFEEAAPAEEEAPSEE